MSNIYIQEPPTHGKVLMVTSQGEVDIELWSKEAPKAARNFIQLCMEKYYDGTIFHRIVKGFIIQGGDPTGTGGGGESIYGKAFKDEFHQRLKFNRRGLVAMANAGPNDNLSQFFFTLDKADELNKKHTIFGKITGKTIFNVLRMADVSVDEDERPSDPPRIIRTEILSNPFDDIIPREIKSKEAKKHETKKISRSKATKNYKLLSFGEEAEDDEIETEEKAKDIRIVSSHDLLNDPKLSSVPAVEEDFSDNSEKRADTAQQNAVRDKLTKRKSEAKDTVQPFQTVEEVKAKRTKELKKESRQLKRELMKKPELEHSEDNKSKKRKEQNEPKNDLMEEVVNERQEFMNKKELSIMKKGSKRESETMALLAGFQSKICELQNEEIKETVEESNTVNDEEEDIGNSWMIHKLVSTEPKHKAKDANIKDEDTFDIYDPRNPMNKRRREKKQEKKHERKHER